MSQTTTVPLTPEQAAEVLAKHESMCWWAARRVGADLPHEDLEDLAAVVRTQFVRALQTWDRSKGFEFATYALRVAIQQARQAARRMRHRGIRVPTGRDVTGPFVVDVDDLRPGDDGAGLLDLIPAPEAEPFSEIPADFWVKAGDVVTARQFRCLRMRYTDGLTFSDIGRRLGCSKTAVQQSLDAAIRSLRKSGVFDRYAELAHD